VLTQAAARTVGFAEFAVTTVFSRPELGRMGFGPHPVSAALAAGRWQTLGRAVVLHNGPLTRAERWRAAVLNCGPRAVLASHSAAEALGLAGWERDELHVLAPAGVPAPRAVPLPIVLHRTSRPTRTTAGGECQELPDALLLAASGFRSPRPACGILAAGVQQRLVTPAALRTALRRAVRVRHRAALLAAVADIAMGAGALSEIDFVRLCRRNGLPVPVQQRVRVEPSGQRRYLDAEWDLPDGRRVVAEVDGALHIVVRRWWSDQLRQNEIAIRRGTTVLRFPSVVVRTEERLVVDQLRRALFDRS
jgi:hypothetical protein